MNSTTALPATNGHKAEDSPDLALARSICYEAVAIALGVPHQEGLNKLAAPETAAALVEAASLLDETLEDSTEGLRFGPRVEELAGAARRHNVTELQESHQRLFGHTSRGQVAAYETEYGFESSTFRQTQELADISGFYEAFGLKTSTRAHERCDHIVAECEFMSFLARKETYSAGMEDGDTLKAVRHAQRVFLGDHLSRFGRAVARSLVENAPIDYYAAAGQMLDALLLSECLHWGVEPADRYIPLRSTADDEVPMACDSCRVPSGNAPNA